MSRWQGQGAPVGSQDGASARIQLAPGTRRPRPELLAGGDPPRLVRLSPAGAHLLDSLLAAGPGLAATTTAGALARRLVRAGLAASQPPPRRLAGGELVAVVPARDRPAALERCLASLAGQAEVVVVDDGSAAPAALAAVARRHHARLVALPANRGPAAARNAGLAATTAPLVAFVDSDVWLPPGTLAHLAGHLADPGVAAVAPRVRPDAGAEAGPRWLRGYLQACSPLDLGPVAGPVRPLGRIGYLPATVLLARRESLSAGFDETLRYGEDVDLVWRLVAAGWEVRYDPSVVVHHAEPTSWGRALARRARYGTSAAPLHRRHPGALAPAVLAPLPAAAALTLLAGRPTAAAVAAGASAGVLAARLRRAGVGSRAAAPVALAFSGSAVLATLSSLGGAAALLAGPGLPAVLLLVPPRRRTALVALLAGRQLATWVRRRPPVDPVRFVLAGLLDDAAYASGVWLSCLRGRTLGPLRPVRARQGRVR